MKSEQKIRLAEKIADIKKSINFKRVLKNDTLFSRHLRDKFKIGPKDSLFQADSVAEDLGPMEG